MLVQVPVLLLLLLVISWLYDLKGYYLLSLPPIVLVWGGVVDVDFIVSNKI